MGDDRFVKFSRDMQYAAISVIALAHLIQNNNPSTWRTADLNNILKNGDGLYQASFKKMRAQQNIKSTPLTLADLLPCIKSGDKYYTLNTTEHLETNVLIRNNLVAALNRFFVEENNHSGVFTYGIFSFAIIREVDSFFLLNSRATAYDGEPLDPLNTESAACLMQMFTITCLADRLLVACDERQMMDMNINDATDNQCTVFVITSLSFVEQFIEVKRSNRKRKQINVESTRKSNRIIEQVEKRTRNDSTQIEVIFGDQFCQMTFSRDQKCYVSPEISYILLHPIFN